MSTCSASLSNDCMLLAVKYLIGLCVILLSDDKSGHEQCSDNQSSSSHAYAQLDNDSKRQENSKPRESQPKQTAKASFFETLQWQDPGEGANQGGELSDEDSSSAKHSRLFKVGESMDVEFANFSSERVNHVPPAGHNFPPVADVSTEPLITGNDLFFTDFSKAGEETTMSSDEVVTADLLGESGWNNSGQAVDLFDLGPPEPTNFDLLSGSEKVRPGNTNGNSSGGIDIFAVDEPMFSSTHSSSADLQAQTNNPFESESLDHCTTTSPLSNMAADLFGTFDPFVDVSGGITKPATVQPTAAKQKEDTLDDDFFAFVESKQSNNVSANKSSDFDLLGNWNMQNIPSGIELNMPRVSSKSDVGSVGLGIPGDIPRVNSAQSMSSHSGKQFGQTNGKPMQKADPFGWFKLFYKQ